LVAVAGEILHFVQDDNGHVDWARGESGDHPTLSSPGVRPPVDSSADLMDNRPCDEPWLLIDTTRSLCGKISGHLLDTASLPRFRRK
jgi:hypothetical protein